MHWPPKNASAAAFVIGALALCTHLTAASAAPRPAAPQGMGTFSKQRLLDSRLTPFDGTLALRDEVDLGVTAVNQTASTGVAWQALQLSAPGAWHALWDKATGVPSRLWGPSLHVAGSVGDGAIAAAAAREFVRDHLALLAPGADIGDFVLVANHFDGRIRTIGFEQYAHGVRVLGGQIGVRFLADRLYLVSSEALPHVAMATANLSRRAPPPAGTTAQARTALQAAVGEAMTAERTEPLAILPLITRGGVHSYRLVSPVFFHSPRLGPFVVYGDAQTGVPVASQRLAVWGQGTLVYDAVTRHPGSERYNAPIGQTPILVNNIATTTSSAGVFSWDGVAAAMVATGLENSEVRIANSQGDVASTQLTVSDGGLARWSASTNEQIDAQIQTFVHAMVVKEYARTLFPGAAFIDRQLVATVNIDSACNAFSDGTNINFFNSSDTCENTGRLADVVYHEYGHVMHRQAIIVGVGSFDGSLSEGISDVVAADITNDSGMGRGFFKTSSPLRELNPADLERRWPEDIGEIHFTGTIFGGAMWDLRVALFAKLGSNQGSLTFRRLLAAAIQRSSNIPTTFMEVLAADDDNGNLADGTPNECEIREAFGRHGLRFVSANFVAPGAVVAGSGQPNIPLSFGIDGLNSACASDQISKIELKWKPLSAGAPAAGKVAATPLDNQWQAALPMPADGNSQAYQFVVEFLDGSTTTLPDNPASPFYQMYQGELVKLYCTSFEEDPFANGWTRGENDIDSSWQWGATSGGERASGDPTTAYSGQQVLGTGLTGTGLYAPNAIMSVTSPPITAAPYSDVRIQYRRWLNVEDAFFDKATITVNGVEVWKNANSNNGDNSAVHHQDREWLFHDIRISGFTIDPVLEVTFALETDQGLNLGGWNIDDFCLVADAWAVCGDGEINGAEQCDQGDGNADAADACRTNCRRAVCGDGILDSAEECDDGARIAGDGCSNNCDIEYNNKSSGCNAGLTHPAGLLLVGAGLGWLAFRRRTHAARTR